MKIETMIYIYLAICICMIVYNCIYVFILRHNENKLGNYAARYNVLIEEQINRLENGLEISESHKDYLRKKLGSVSHLTAFDKSMENIYNEDYEKAQKYLFEIFSVFMYLSIEYHGKDTIQAAYFPYILGKYDILDNENFDIITEIMYDLLSSEDIYCRENALGAIYSRGDVESVIRALEIIDDNSAFHHPKLISDGLLKFDGDMTSLVNALLDNFDVYSQKMQLNILNFIRFSSVRCDDAMLAIMTDETKNHELHFSCIRYFEKYPCEKARVPIQDFAENLENRIWEYQSIASSALRSYPDERTTEILTKNLSNRNWYVRLNSAVSFEKMGFTYYDLINVFEGEDRFAREILRYQFDRRDAQKEVADA